jgi:hypothetical protein
MPHIVIAYILNRLAAAVSGIINMLNSISKAI